MKDENKGYQSPQVITTEDKLRLTLKEYNEINGGASKMTTHLGFFISFATVLFTAEFKTVFNISGNLIQAGFIVLTLVFGALFLLSSVKLLRNKLKGSGDETWFLYRVQGKEKPQLTSKDKGCSFDFLELLGVALRTALYLLPLGIWVLVMCLIGWENAWLTTIVDDKGVAMPSWLVSLFLSAIWLVPTYLWLFIFWHEIEDFFDDRFY